MKLRRLLPFLILFALLAAPFGRMAAAEAMAMSHHAPAAGHCSEMPAPDADKSDKAAIDCLMACAAMAPAEEARFDASVPAMDEPIASAASCFSGRHPEADPPPPRIS